MNQSVYQFTDYYTEDAAFRIFAKAWPASVISFESAEEKSISYVDNLFAKKTE